MPSSELVCPNCNADVTQPEMALPGAAPQCPRCQTVLGFGGEESQSNVDESRTHAELAGDVTQARRIPKEEVTNEEHEELDIRPPALPPRSVEFLRPAQQADEMGRLAQYRVLSVLGEGGMGLVFHAEDVLLKRPVALKVIKPEVLSRPGTKDRFLREAQSVARVDHEHVIPIHQVGVDQSVLFLAMPLLVGETLDQRLKREPPLEIADAVRIARETAEGLEAAHVLGLVHRDIKPGNLWLEASKDGSATFRRVKVLDFGLARIQDAEDRLTRSGTVLGTPSYMAPEQAGGEIVDARADLWSLGVVLYRMLTGTNPFARTDMLATLAAVAVDEPKPASELNPKVPKALADLVARLLTKDAGKRPASGAAIAAELQAIENGLRAPSRAQRWKWPLIAAAVVLALVIVGGGAALILRSMQSDYVTAEQALTLEGKEATVQFTVKSMGRTNAGNWIMLNSQANFTDPKNFHAAIKNGAVRMADFKLDDEIVERTIRVSGPVSKFKGRPQIVVVDPEQLVILPK